MTGTPDPMSGQVFAHVAELIARIRRIPAESVTIDQTFQDLGIDSMDGVNLMFELESEFHVEIPDAAVQSIRSVREMVDGIQALLAARDSSLVAQTGHVEGSQ